MGATISQHPSAETGQPIAVGLVGAGPWAHAVHAPMLAAGPETLLAGVWTRRFDVASRLAGRYGAPAYRSFDELLNNCDAVAFCVPPGVQAALAPIAARAGKALLLEKPIAADLAGADRLAEAAAETGVPSMLMLTWRFSTAGADFLTDAAAFRASGGHAWLLSNAHSAGAYATPWRRERGALLDLGPHVIDFLDVALGSVVGVTAQIHRLGRYRLSFEHESGAVSQAEVCARSPLATQHAGVTLFGPSGHLTANLSGAGSRATFARARSAFAEAVT